MDLVLDYADSSILTPYVYPATWPEDNAFRQIISLFVITNLGAIVLYLLFATLSYYLLFDHKLMKHPQFLERFHKPHHVWKIPTPFASHAFHPLDGFSQSIPYHIYPFLFPLHKVTYLVLYIFVNVWTISIHDGNYCVPGPLKSIINGSAHHTDHHLYFNYNYGQYFTLWDRIGGSYKNPSSFEGQGPHAYLEKLANGQEDKKLPGAKNK
ncbi:PREDICTED: lathosterol oxidase [Thamnophis sirtalis]|uniref:Lathosterol oxidase n=1 Tax=Thamnophis sirtalis TaxID=35019 RepID=A0A6I9YKX8_9SAUR|nr:PREDICTED: lathosterol oxidase [Thamnophis sirtalis]